MNDKIKNVSFIFPKGSLEDDWREEALRHREEISQLKDQLQQKENIIKEVREYIENYPTLRYSSMDNSNGNRLTGKLIPTDKILEILDKVSDE